MQSIDRIDVTRCDNNELMKFYIYQRLMDLGEQQVSISFIDFVIQIPMQRTVVDFPKELSVEKGTSWCNTWKMYYFWHEPIVVRKI